MSRFKGDITDFTFIPKTGEKAGFDPNQPRDSSGRWGSGNALETEAKKHKTPEAFINEALNRSGISVQGELETIDINKISGTDYAELDEALRTNTRFSIDEATNIISPTDEYIVGQKVIWPIEVYENDDNTYSLYAGNHRLMQKLINGETNVLANIANRRKDVRKQLRLIWYKANSKFQKAGFDPNQPRRPDGTWGAGEVDWKKDPYKLSQSELEQKIMDQDIESGALYDAETGELILFKDGESRRVTFTVYEIETFFEGNIFTHNHPEGEFWLSPNDIQNQLLFKTLKTRAISTGGLWSEVTTNRDVLENWDWSDSELRSNWTSAVESAISRGHNYMRAEYDDNDPFHDWSKHRINMYMGRKVISYLANEDHIFKDILNLRTHED